MKFITGTHRPHPNPIIHRIDKKGIRVDRDVPTDSEFPPNLHIPRGGERCVGIGELDGVRHGVADVGRLL